MWICSYFSSVRKHAKTANWCIGKTLKYGCNQCVNWKDNWLLHSTSFVHLQIKKHAVAAQNCLEPNVNLVKKLHGSKSVNAGKLNFSSIRNMKTSLSFESCSFAFFCCSCDFVSIIRNVIFLKLSGSNVYFILEQIFLLQGQFSASSWKECPLQSWFM